MKIRESGEMYLEHILSLHRERGAVRAIDVASRSGYSKPSVSRALSLLKAAGYVTVEENGNVLLTEEGEALAEKVAERHRILSDFLKSIGVSDAVSDADACKIEHVISDETFEMLKSFVSEREKRS
ncbi:MAG: MarR family transcriptional regulator [Clostridia bacterium]|nr:MarR family transcriptional regulator [Clostridia bacterium]